MLVSFDIKGKHNSKRFTIYKNYRNTYQQGSKLLQSYIFKNREFSASS